MVGNHQKLFTHVSAGAFTPAFPFTGRSTVPLCIKLHFIFQIVIIIICRTFRLTNWRKFVKIRIELPYIDKSCNNYYRVWKSVYLFQCTFSLDRSHQNALTKLLAALLNVVAVGLILGELGHFKQYEPWFDKIFIVWWIMNTEIASQ